MHVLQVEVGCPGAMGGGGGQSQSHPKAEEHPLGYMNPQPRHEPLCTKPHNSTCHIEAREETQCKIEMLAQK